MPDTQICRLPAKYSTSSEFELYNSKESSVRKDEGQRCLWRAEKVSANNNNDAKLRLCEIVIALSFKGKSDRRKCTHQSHQYNNSNGACTKDDDERWRLEELVFGE